MEAAGLGGALALLPLDLGELAMLGDAGSNLLGYLVGVGLMASLPAWGLGVALAAVLLVHLAAETVTLSRIIRAAPPLRGLDDIGRRERHTPERAPRRPASS